MSKIIFKKINLAITNITKLYGAQINFDIPYSSPGIYNDESLTQLILNSGNSVLGDKNTIILEQASLGGEDFAFYLKKIPGVYFRIGCFDGKATDLHCNFFDIDEKCIKTGIQILNDAILNYKFI